MTEHKYETVIKADWLPGLGSFFSDQGPLSPFAGSGEASLSAEQIQAMKEAGVLASDGSLGVDASQILNAVISASSIARLRMVADDVEMEYHVYFQDTQPVVSMLNTTNGLVYSKPPESDVILHIAAQHSGMSQVATLSLDETLSHEEALCLMALIDLDRKNVLFSYANGTEIESTRRTAKDVLASLQRMGLDSASLLWLLQTLMPEAVTFQADVVSTVLDQLVEKEMLVKHADGYEAMGHTILLVMRLIQIQTLYRIDTFTVKNTTSARLRYGVMQNGAKDFLLMEISDTAIRLKGLSAERFLALVAEVFDRPPEVIEDPEEQSLLVLKILTGPLKGEIVELGDEVLTIGRSKNNKLVLHDESASGKHAEIHPTDDGFEIIDVGSSNGTYVNGHELTANEPMQLKVKDAIKISETLIHVVAGESADESEDEDEEDEARTVLATPADVVAATPPPKPVATPQTSSCPSCGAPVKPGAKFCGGCGATLGGDAPQPSAPSVCPSCGAALKPGAQFCGSCGSRV